MRKGKPGPKVECEHKTMDIIQLTKPAKSKCRKCGIIAEIDVDLTKKYGTG